MVILRLCRRKFYIKKCCSRRYSIAVEFYSQKPKIALWATLWGLRGNVRTPSIARWKARGRLPIRHNWTSFAISYGWDVISGNLSKSAFFEWGRSLWMQISERMGHRPPTTVGIRKLEWLPFRVVSKCSQCIVWFCHKADACVTDRQTDRITTANTAARAVKHIWIEQKLPPQ